MKGLRKNRAFSLVELLIVIVILVILSTVIYINWHEATTFLDQQTSIFSNDLRYARNFAISKNERCRLEITLPNQYRLLDSSDTPQTMPPSKGDPTTKIVTLENNITFQQITGVTNTIIFDGKGTPYKDTTPEEVADTDIVITLQNQLGQTRDVTITHTTGKISI